MGRASEGWLPVAPQGRRSLTAYGVMERLGIAALGKRHIRALSGGQQQRAFLGRALFSNPRLLLLDEPTAGVDIKTRDDILHLLDELNHEGVTIVMTTHETQRRRRAPAMGRLRERQRIIAEGPPSEVYTPEILQPNLWRGYDGRAVRGHDARR